MTPAKMFDGDLWVLASDAVQMAENAYKKGQADEREVRSMRWDELIAKAVESEREACAKLIDEAKVNIWEFHPYQMREAAQNVCTNLAAAIRARGQDAA